MWLMQRVNLSCFPQENSKSDRNEVNESVNVVDAEIDLSCFAQKNSKSEINEINEVNVVDAESDLLLTTRNSKVIQRL